MPDLKLHTIIPGRLYQRGEFRKHPLEWKQWQLFQRGITCVVSLVGRDDELAEVLGDGYLHLPIADGKTLDPGPLLTAARIVGNRLERGGVVLVHCHAGRNRSALFSALLVVRLRSTSGSAAVEYVRRARPNALANEVFVRFLESVEGYDPAAGRYRLRLCYA